MNIVVYGDSISWGIIPCTRNRLTFEKRWTGVLQAGLGNKARVIEECLNGRTTQFNDINRPSRNGLDHIAMIVESHSPIDLMIVMLGINDFQNVIGANAKESASGLRCLVSKIQSLSPEPLRKPPEVLVIIPPEINNPTGQMADKFSDYAKGKNSESEYISAIEALGVHILESSECVSLSALDGIHLDEAEHYTLGKEVYSKICAIGML